MKTAYYVLMLFPAATALYWMTPCHGDACLGNGLFGLLTLGACALLLPLGLAVSIISIRRSRIDKLQIVLCALHIAFVACFGWQVYYDQSHR